MNVVVVGTGYVGLVTGTCFSEMGVNVTCVDVNKDKIDALKQGVVPIYEPGLEELIKKNTKADRLHFSTDLKECQADADVVFIAVGTPSGEDGSADLHYVLDVAKEFGQNIEKYTLLVVKSTVPVGTTYKVKEAVAQQLQNRGKEIPFDVASNPEFLKEGAAIKDFMSPDRYVIGVESAKAKEIMERLYRPFQLNHNRLIYMDILSAEMTKYASNAMLATRISFMNEIAALCEATGANVDNVRAGIASDSRIGGKFLYPGCGYGGSCFPKDVKALINTGAQHGVDMKVIKAVEDVNNLQKEVVYNKLQKVFGGDLSGKRIAVWGLSFKPETDDMRQAPSLVVIEKLLQAGAKVVAYDPIAMQECQKYYFKDAIEYASSSYNAAQNADALVVLTEWKQFRAPDWDHLRELMNGNIVVDGRNIYNTKELKEYGFNCLGIGK